MQHVNTNVISQVWWQCQWEVDVFGVLVMFRVQ